MAYCQQGLSNSLTPPERHNCLIIFKAEVETLAAL